jgi:hypothetical protein
MPATQPPLTWHTSSRPVADFSVVSTGARLEESKACVVEDRLQVNRDETFASQPDSRKNSELFSSGTGEHHLPWLRAANLEWTALLDQENYPGDAPDLRFEPDPPGPCERGGS